MQNAARGEVQGCGKATLDRLILRAIANRNNNLQSAVFDGGRRIAPQSALFICPLPKHNIVVLCNRGQDIIGYLPGQLPTVKKGT